MVKSQKLAGKTGGYFVYRTKSFLSALIGIPAKKYSPERREVREIVLCETIHQIPVLIINYDHRRRFFSSHPYRLTG